eukprot:scaffold1962_cov180-Ochromonas_danica.AAC.11
MPDITISFCSLISLNPPANLSQFVDRRQWIILRTNLTSIDAQIAVYWPCCGVRERFLQRTNLAAFNSAAVLRVRGSSFYLNTDLIGSIPNQLYHQPVMVVVSSNAPLGAPVQQMPIAVTNTPPPQGVVVGGATNVNYATVSAQPVYYDDKKVYPQEADVSAQAMPFNSVPAPPTKRQFGFLIPQGVLPGQMLMVPTPEGNIIQPTPLAVGLATTAS